MAHTDLENDVTTLVVEGYVLSEALGGVLGARTKVLQGSVGTCLLHSSASSLLPGRGQRAQDTPEMPDWALPSDWWLRPQC